LRNLKKRPVVNLFLLKPSNYDEEGYIVRYFRGVLPSNTLACLAGLTEEAKNRGRLAAYDIRVRLIDEAVVPVKLGRIIRLGRKSKTIVCLVGVQTVQFPRAADIARLLRRHGITVLLGGFHVSGYLKMFEEVPADIQELLDAGVTIVKGEVEETWASLLEEAIEGTLKPLYDLLDTPPDLSSAPIPLVSRGYLRRFVFRDNGTIDCSRGCPYKCSFCTIINVQGRKMRLRSPDAIEAALRENYRKRSTSFYFFTDDNFARNRNWEAIFDVLIRLREEEKIPLSFMMQVDVLSYRTPGFVEKAARAGCSNVFIGMESLNPANLAAASKNQNLVGDFKSLIAAYKTAGIWCHVGYILGFPFDTRESILADLKRLMDEIQVDMASFFILTPLPGSVDHARYVREGAYVSPDFNLYDSFHETMDYPGFPTPGSLSALYEEVWKSFYSFENMTRVLQRSPDTRYWKLFFNFLWYRAALLEKRHPMTAGLLRMKGRRQVRPDVTPMPLIPYALKRWKELRNSAVNTAALLMEMQLVWLETRKQSDLEKRVVAELRKLERKKVRLSDLQAAYARVAAGIPSVRVPSSITLFVQKWNPFTLQYHFYSREEIITFWERTVRDLRHGRAYSLLRPAVLKRIWLDTKLTLHFMRACVGQNG
jgi:radical SAM superfamily enzyme YgiQ (UPF0313 family)